ncbi:hypothetical protein QYE80_13425 [Pseudomonas tohonis]|uniref:hypothetical protein n=1 Tax=Pseudomonas sp. zfem005 TaxID=3078200 RepID=UPI000396CD6D|nr:hypothetical protein [Pseudomonas sp. zfem005]EQM72078.1 hypothetical protein L682_00325 [Pseudomonas alcaligenes OT 69]MDN4145990.1 hypothetical protein [Pseudomonas tohonis]MDU9415324.1 hypothetical protein [Pseudomonas sp. zfem005]
MLTAEQEEGLLVALFATAEAMGHQLTESAALMMIEDLRGYDEPVIAAALQACRREVAGRLTLAAILQRVLIADGRPGRDEAWSIALMAADEFESVMLTEEVLAALQVAKPSLVVRDRIGARMAFLSAYDRLLEAARQSRRPVKWTLSIGFDAERRAAAVESAVLLRRLPAPEGEALLADLRGKHVTQDGHAIAGLITGQRAPASPDVRERLQAIRNGLTAGRRRKPRSRRD